jgi:hypothetical protein
MIEYTRPYDGRSDGANPSPGEVSWSVPFDLVLEFHKNDADGADASAIFAALVAGDHIGFGNDGYTFVVVEAVAVMNRWRVTVEDHIPPQSTDLGLIAFRRYVPDPGPEPEPGPPAHPRPWRAEVTIR